MLAGLVNLNRWLAIRLPRVRRLSMTEVSAEGGRNQIYRSLRKGAAKAQTTGGNLAGFA